MKPSTNNMSDDYTFECSGRTFYANCHIVGINPKLQVYEGFDGDVRHANDIPEYIHDKNDAALQDYFTRPEKRELADYMIQLWTAYKQAAT